MLVTPQIQAPEESGRTFFTPRLSGSRSMFGFTSDLPYWAAISKLYDEDKLQGASDLLEKTGIGQGATGLPVYRLVEAELTTRLQGRQISIAPHVNLEFVPAEQHERIEPMKKLIEETVSGLHERFGWNGQDEVLVTLLSFEQDTPWATSRYGYCAQKSDYYKICIPYHATSDPQSFWRVFAHEYAHVISLSASKRRVNHWVGEGFSVYASNGNSDHSRRIFLSHRSLWLDPPKLERQFGPGVELGSQAKWLAYSQAGWIVQYLARSHGDKHLLGFLSEYADESILRSLKLLALGESRTRDALKSAYSTSPERLFQAVRANLASL